MSDLALQFLQDEPEDEPKRFYGVTTGTVIQTVFDPMFLSRVQVRLPWIDDPDLSPFARVASLMAGPTHGMYFIPNPGDEVLVAFEHGDINVPYIIGSVWNGGNVPPLPSPDPQMRMIRTLVGNQIMFTEVPPTISILTPTGNSVVVGGPGVTITSLSGVVYIEVGTTVLTISNAGVSVVTPNITLAASNTLSLVGETINITGSAACNIAAPMVNINP
jgi:phage baseplate assembly protein gpV